MSASLILARHGDTFEPGQTTVWIGARSDPPLTANGRAQARALAAALSVPERTPRAILCGPLRRTRETALIIAQHLTGAPPPRIDERLREIDYGRWEGMTRAATRAAFGEEADAYEARGVWPASAGFRPGREEMLARVDALIAEAATAQETPLLLVTSNGVLRLFAERASPPRPGAKMRTGAMSFLNVDGATAKILDWNVTPA